MFSNPWTRSLMLALIVIAGLLGTYYIVMIGLGILIMASVIIPARILWVILLFIVIKKENVAGVNTSPAAPNLRTVNIKVV